MARITVFDTTLRDGEQSPGCTMTPSEKLRMAHQLEELGVDVIEAGFPIASDTDFDAVGTIAREIREPVIAALARATVGRHRPRRTRGEGSTPVAHPHLHRDI